jgi:polynucleotide 5'-hydroxyl-kinase GRC3/NOL9
MCVSNINSFPNRLTQILRAPDHAVYTHSTPESWSDALNSLSGAVTQAQNGEDEDEFGEYGSEMIDRSAPILAIMKGQKRSGKSTFGRELVNRLLSRYETVAYLDCDLGQSEFSPGGSVGLYVVKSPLLGMFDVPCSSKNPYLTQSMSSGPSWTHPIIPARSHFIGSLNPRLQSEHYIECIASLLEHYRYEMQYPFDLSNKSSEKISEVVPLVINTQGWVKGLGADLLGQIETLVQATHTFIFASNEYENGDDNDNRQFAGEDYDAVPEHHIMGGFGRVMQLQAAPPSGLFSRFSPADSRTLATISYLHARLSREAPVVWDFSEPLVGMLPWEVSLQDAIKRIHLTGEGSDSIVEDDLGVALNGSLVGLLAYTGDVPEGERYEMGEPLPSSQNTTCVGLGLIRAVAPGDHSIQLLTPVAAEQFSSVNALVRGDLELPLCGSLDWRNSSVRVNEGGLLGVAWSEVPFLGIKPERGVGGGRRRLRRNIMRKNQAS